MDSSPLLAQREKVKTGGGPYQKEIFSSESQHDFPWKRSSLLRWLLTSRWVSSQMPLDMKLDSLEEIRI